VRFAVQLLLHEGLGSGAWDVGKKKD
jgi:hypothetical protein